VLVKPNQDTLYQGILGKFSSNMVSPGQRFLGEVERGKSNGDEHL
jgi:hypothetical protein